MPINIDRKSRSLRKLERPQINKKQQYLLSGSRLQRPLAPNLAQFSPSPGRLGFSTPLSQGRDGSAEGRENLF